MAHAVADYFTAYLYMAQILQDRVAIPVWEIIVVRMSITWLGCYGCECFVFRLPPISDVCSPSPPDMRFANVEHPLFGPPGVRFLLCTRGVVGFFGTWSAFCFQSHPHLHLRFSTQACSACISLSNICHYQMRPSSVFCRLYLLVCLLLSSP